MLRESENNMDVLDNTEMTGEEKMLADSGYSETAIRYYMDKPYMGDLPDANQVTEMLGTCGDTMKIFLKIEDDLIKDAKYQVLGCPGAISAAMAAVDIVKGEKIEYARSVNDGDIFKVLKEIPAKKHHCIQLAVKTLQKAIDEYENGSSSITDDNCRTDCVKSEACCKKDML